MGCTDLSDVTILLREHHLIEPLTDLAFLFLVGGTRTTARLEKIEIKLSSHICRVQDFSTYFNIYLFYTNLFAQSTNYACFTEVVTNRFSRNKPFVIEKGDPRVSSFLMNHQCIINASPKYDFSRRYHVSFILSK